MRKIFTILFWIAVVMTLALILRQNLLGENHTFRIGALICALFLGVIVQRRNQAHEDGQTAQSGSVMEEITALMRTMHGTEDDLFSKEVLRELISKVDRAMRFARTDATLPEERRIVLLPILGDLKIALERAWTSGVIDDHQGAAMQATAQARGLLASLDA